MIKYIISSKAVEDVNSIWKYTAENWSIDQANRYYNLIFDEIEFVVENIETAHDFSYVRKNYRYSKVKSHLIFFKCIKNGTIEVVRVLHERMDIKNRLKEI
jgi:toxin ParE1/3/4